MTRTLYKDLFLLFVGLALFYAIVLGIRPIGVPDEGRYASVAYHMYLSGDYLTPRLNGSLFMDKPVLYYWFEAISMHIFGVSNWSIRIPPVLLSIFSTLSVFVVCHRFFNRTTAFIASLILATSPFWYNMSQYANMDIEIAAWVTLTLNCILLGLQTPSGGKKRALFYLAYVFAAGATLTKGLAGIIFPMLILGVFSIITAQWRLIKTIYLPSGIFIYLILVLPWMLLMQQAHPGFFHYFFIEQQVNRYLSSHFNNIQPPWFFVEIIVIGLLPWSLLIPASLWKSFRSAPDLDHSACDKGRQASLFLSLWALLIFVFFSLPSSKPIGYILPVFPPLAILIAHNLYLWIQQKEPFHWYKYSMIIFSLLFSIAFILSGLFDLPFMDNYNSIKPWFLVVGIAGITGALLSIITHNKKQILTCMFIFPAVLSLCLPGIVGKIDKRSLQPLAKQLAPYITPETIIVNYEKLYYDLPLIFHLKQPVYVVANWDDKQRILASDNWRRELYLGMKGNPEVTKWLIVHKRFNELIRDSSQPVLIFAGEQAKHHLLQKDNLHLLSEYHGTVVMSNKVK